MHPTAHDLGLRLGWSFNEVLPQTFERNRIGFEGRKFPVVAPVPANGTKTCPIEGEHVAPPYLYVVYNNRDEIMYVGVVTDRAVKYVFDRWIRPSADTRASFWAHGTNKKGKSTIEWIAEAINNGDGPIRVYFTNCEYLLMRLQARADALGIDTSPFHAIDDVALIEALEHAWIFRFQPAWNVQKKRSYPDSMVARCADYWNK